jgi:hypothetical protein
LIRFDIALFFYLILFSENYNEGLFDSAHTQTHKRVMQTLIYLFVWSISCEGEVRARVSFDLVVVFSVSLSLRHGDWKDFQGKTTDSRWRELGPPIAGEANVARRFELPLSFYWRPGNGKWRTWHFAITRPRAMAEVNSTDWSRPYRRPVQPRLISFNWT